VRAYPRESQEMVFDAHDTGHSRLITAPARGASTTTVCYSILLILWDEVTLNGGGSWIRTFSSVPDSQRFRGFIRDGAERPSGSRHRPRRGRQGLRRASGPSAPRLCKATVCFDAMRQTDAGSVVYGYRVKCAPRPQRFLLGFRFETMPLI
jgi:hypothetical protein